MTHDADLIRSAARRVGLTIAIAMSVIVVLVLIGALYVVLGQVSVAQLLSGGRLEGVDIDGRDVLIGGIIIGVVAIIGVGVLAFFVARRAVVPLVDALARQRRFVADASHELRTPVAIVDTRLQLLQRSLAADDPSAGALAAVRDDVRALSVIITDLLESLDVAPNGPERGEVADTVRVVTSSLGVLAAERNIRISVEVPELVVTLADTSLQRCLLAVIDNALGHTPDGSTITVTARAAKGFAHIAVADQGGGVQGIDSNRVFERFARAEGRTGFGIGLALVQETLGRVGGHAEVTATSENGTTMTLVIPLAGKKSRAS